jgi:putative tryptophan/tyrosine transport system substrate-binding protein
MPCMRRRDFVSLLGGATLAWPLTARAQQPAMPVIGFLNGASRNLYADRLSAFHDGLKEGGFVEGQNLAIEYRWADGQYERLPALALDLVSRNVAVIATTDGVPETLAAKAATTTIPIVFQTGVNPVTVGLVTSLNRPGGNLTGVTQLSVELAPKLLEFMHEIVPSATVFGFLINPSNRAHDPLPKDLDSAARVPGLKVQILRASTEHDFDTGFATLLERRAGGLGIGADAFFSSRSEQLASLALRHGMPAIQPFRRFVLAGGLMSYGGSITAAQRLAGVYTDRILKGEKPGELPVQQSTKVEMFINLKTAKELGLTIPENLLVAADEVIE